MAHQVDARFENRDAQPEVAGSPTWRIKYLLEDGRVVVATTQHRYIAATGFIVDEVVSIVEAPDDEWSAQALDDLPNWLPNLDDMVSKTMPGQTCSHEIIQFKLPVRAAIVSGDFGDPSYPLGKG